MSPERQARLTRRIILASMLVAASIWYLAGVMEFDKNELLGFVTSTFTLVLIAIMLAVLVVVPFKLVQSWRKKSKKGVSTLK